MWLIWELVIKIRTPILYRSVEVLKLFPHDLFVGDQILLQKLAEFATGLGILAYFFPQFQVL